MSDLEAGFDAFQNGKAMADKVGEALQGVMGHIVRKGKALGEFVSLAGAGDTIRFARSGVAVNPRNEMFYNAEIEVSHLHLIYKIEILKRQRQQKK